MVHNFGEPRDPNDQLMSQLRLSDNDNQDIDYAHRMAIEIIDLSGEDLIVYKRIKNNSYNKVWEEDSNPLYEPGQIIRGFFAPQPVASVITKYGADVPNQTTITFAAAKVQEVFKQNMIVEGDLIQIPYRSNVRKLNRYRVLNSFDSGNFRYTWLYLSCLVENLTDDKEIDIHHK